MKQLIHYQNIADANQLCLFACSLILQQIFLCPFLFFQFSNQATFIHLNLRQILIVLFYTVTWQKSSITRRTYAAAIKIRTVAFSNYNINSFTKRITPYLFHTFGFSGENALHVFNVKAENVGWGPCVPFQQIHYLFSHGEKQSADRVSSLGKFSLSQRTRCVTQFCYFCTRFLNTDIYCKATVWTRQNYFNALTLVVFFFVCSSADEAL